MGIIDASGLLRTLGEESHDFVAAVDDALRALDRTSIFMAMVARGVPVAILVTRGGAACRDLEKFADRHDPDAAAVFGRGEN